MAGTFLPKSALAQAHSKYIAISGNKFRKNGDIFELVDVISPDPNALLHNARQFAEVSRKILQDTLNQENFIIEYTERPHRWGHKLVRLKANAKTHTDICEQLVLSGAVRVSPVTDNNNHILKLLAAEFEAQQNKAGLWALPFYRVRNANILDDARDSIGAMHIFEGNIVKIGQFSGRRFLNFGDDYKTDITATIEGRYARQWEKDGLEFDKLEGEFVQFRGFVEWINGPSIALKHRQSLQIIRSL